MLKNWAMMGISCPGNQGTFSHTHAHINIILSICMCRAVCVYDPSYFISISIWLDEKILINMNKF